MNYASHENVPRFSILRVLRDHPLRWLLPAVGAMTLAATYALVRPATWEASQALIVRNEATNSQDAPGRFVQPDEMKTVQETILELVKSCGVLAAALEQVGPPDLTPSPQPSPEGRGEAKPAWPSPDEIAELRDAVKLVPPKGAEFGKTEVFYLKVRDRDARRAIALADALCRQLEAAIEKLRDAKAQSMIRELQKAVEVADADLGQSTAKLSKIEREVGSDLTELRLLCEANAGESALQRTATEIRTELRQIRAAQKSNEQLLALLKQALAEPDRLVAMPNTLLDSQPALKKLKEGLIDAQLNAAQLQGRMSDGHPLVIAATHSQVEIRSRLNEELANAIRAIDADLRLGMEKASLLDGQLAALGVRLNVLAALRAPYANQIAQTRKCSELLDRAQQRLADARASHATAGATSLISAIDSPDAGTRPIGPGRATIVLLGMAGGLLAGFGVVLLTFNPDVGPRGDVALAFPEHRPNASFALLSATPLYAGNGTSPNGNRRRHVPLPQRKPAVEDALKTLTLRRRSTDL